MFPESFDPLEGKYRCIYCRHWVFPTDTLLHLRRCPHRNRRDPIEFFLACEPCRVVYAPNDEDAISTHKHCFARARASNHEGRGSGFQHRSPAARARRDGRAWEERREARNAMPAAAASEPIPVPVQSQPGPSGFPIGSYFVPWMQGIDVAGQTVVGELRMPVRRGTLIFCHGCRSPIDVSQDLGHFYRCGPPHMPQ